jgi:hypothetical protein
MLLGHVEFDLYIRNKKRPDKNALDHDMEQGCLLTNMITDFAVRLRKKLACWDSDSDICCAASKSDELIILQSQTFFL